MLRVSVAGEDDLEQWQAYVAARPEAKAMHHAAWFRILQDAFSVSCHFLVARSDSGRICGVLPLYVSRSFLTGKHVASLDDGLLANDASAARALNEAAIGIYRETGARYLLLRNSAFAGEPPLVSIQRTTVRRIVGTALQADELFRTLSSYARRDVRRASARGYRIVEDRELAAIDGPFYDEYAMNLRQLGTPVVSRSMFASMKHQLGPACLRLYLALRGDHVVGGLLCVVAPSGWTALYGVVRHELLGDYANYLLYWHAIAEASRSGSHSLDLGSNAVGSGSHQFKQKWPGVDRETQNTYLAAGIDCVPEFAKVYAGNSLRQRIWKQLPLTVTNRLGPILRAGLPFG